jgi:hypothetical protein
MHAAAREPASNSAPTSPSQHLACKCNKSYLVFPVGKAQNKKGPAGTAKENDWKRHKVPASFMHRLRSIVEVWEHRDLVVLDALSCRSTILGILLQLFSGNSDILERHVFVWHTGVFVMCGD